MDCQHCGRYSPPCPETGYDADTLCPSCAEAAENELQFATPAILSLRMQFCAGPQTHTFHACERHRAELLAGAADQNFRLIRNEQPTPADDKDCDFCYWETL